MIRRIKPVPSVGPVTLDEVRQAIAGEEPEPIIPTFYDDPKDYGCYPPMFFQESSKKPKKKGRNRA